MAEVYFKNITSMAGGLGADAMDPRLQAVVDQDKNSYQLNNMEEVMTKMGYARTAARNPNDKFSVEHGAEELPEKQEMENFELIVSGKTGDKGYAIKAYGGKKAISKLAYDWTQNVTNIKSEKDSVRRAIGNMGLSIGKLKLGAKKSVAIEATKVFTNGFGDAVNQYGNGSLTIHGENLFDTAHSYDQGMASFRNILGGGFGTTNGVLNSTNLQAALNLLKEETRLQNGDWVDDAPEFKLIVGRKNELTAKSIMNGEGNLAQFAGTGSNANLANTFTFDNNNVEVTTNPFIGFNSKKFGQVGTGTEWFVCQSYAAAEAMALRMIVLNDGEVDMWKDHNSGVYYVSYYKSCATDHFGLEPFVAASKGTV